jgi:NitT/TauT family transport system permease protein
VAQKKAGVRSVVIPMVTLVAVLLLWEVAESIFDFNKLVMPAPHEIAAAIRTNADTLLYNTGVTMLEAVLGFALGSIVAVLLAIAFTLSPTVSYAVYPFAVALKSTPLIALAPLLIVWFGNGLVSKVVMSALVAFFPVLVNMVDGLSSFEREINDLMRSLSASRWQMLTKIRLPNSLPHLFSALKIASSLAVVGAVIGEFTGATRGIGFLINRSSYYLDTDVMFAGIVLISLSGILFFGALVMAERKIVFWQEGT